MKKIIITIVCLVALFSVSLSGLNIYREHKAEQYETTLLPVSFTDKAELTEETLEAVYLFDVFNKEKVVGFVDYMFVAKIESIKGTTYRAVSYNSDTKEYAGTPYTCYEITVVENIKGNLVLNEKIPLKKLGGISIDGKSYMHISKDTMPTENGYYLFLGYADSEGELYVCDPNSTIYLGDEYNSENSSLKEYRLAFENQDLSERVGERKICKYDVNAK